MSESDGGIEHFMAHLMDPLQGMMKAIGTPNITPELKQTVIDGVMREAAGRSVEELAQEENKVLIGLLKLRANGQSTPSAAKKGSRANALAGGAARAKSRTRQGRTSGPGARVPSNSRAITVVTKENT